VSEPRFLSFEQIETLHGEAIRRFGGALGIRDRGGLESAIVHPQNVRQVFQK
jgi:death-on-curing protein